MYRTPQNRSLCCVIFSYLSQLGNTVDFIWLPDAYETIFITVYSNWKLNTHRLKNLIYPSLCPFSAYRLEIYVITILAALVLWFQKNLTEKCKLKFFPRVFWLFFVSVLKFISFCTIFRLCFWFDPFLQTVFLQSPQICTV